MWLIKLSRPWEANVSLNPVNRRKWKKNRINKIYNDWKENDITKPKESGPEKSQGGNRKSK